MNRKQKLLMEMVNKGWSVGDWRADLIKVLQRKRWNPHSEQLIEKVATSPLRPDVWNVATKQGKLVIAAGFFEYPEIQDLIAFNDVCHTVFFFRPVHLQQGGDSYDIFEVDDDDE